MNDDLENNFEKFPGSSGEVSGERMAEAAKWEESMSIGVPEFAGNQFGIANKENQFYGETVDGAETDEESGEKYDASIADAAALINYGLNAAARELGVEQVIQKLKGFDASGRSDPINDFFVYLGVDTPEERREVQKEALVAAPTEAEFREGPNQPSQKKSTEGAFAAIDDMKRLIAEVEGANPKYEALRQGARAAGKGYFDYAVSEFGVRGLTELFQVLAAQEETKKEPEEQIDDTIEEEKDDTKSEALNPDAMR